MQQPPNCLNRQTEARYKMSRETAAKIQDFARKNEKTLGYENALKIAREFYEKKEKESKRKKEKEGKGGDSPPLFHAVGMKPEINLGLASKIDSFYSESTQKGIRSQSQIILNAIKNFDSVTTLELEESTGIKHTNILKIVNTLYKENKIELAGRKLNRQSGKLNVAYKVKGN